MNAKMPEMDPKTPKTWAPRQARMPMADTEAKTPKAGIRAKQALMPMVLQKIILTLNILGKWYDQASDRTAP